MGFVDDLSSEVVAEAVSWRHHLHRNPELAYKEKLTAEFVASRLGEFGLSVHRGLGGTGVVGTLARGAGGRTIAIRADMDALPIQEQNGLSHMSCNAGVMHACGHDGHVAMALAAARVCARMSHLNGTVHFIFQPAEENECGGRRMIEDGLFRCFPCDAIYALHNWPALPLHTCAALDGAMMAALALFEIKICGKSAHGAMPHQGTDPILAACQMVSCLNTIVSRNTDPLHPAVLSVTQILGGDTSNVIPDVCVVRGTARWFDDATGDLLERRMSEISKAVASGLGCEVQTRYERRLPATINHPAAAELVRAVATSSPLNLRLADARPSMGSEDFAFMLSEVPGCYVWLGAGTAGQNQGLHSSRYDFNDDLIPIGLKLWTSLIRNELRQE